MMESIESRQLMSISVAFVDVPISSAAKAADSTLNNLRTLDVKLTVSSGDDWLASDLLLRLTTGSFYNPGAGGNTPNQAAWTPLPYLEFDTFVAGPGFSNNVTILGRKEGSGAAVFSPTEVNVAFGDLVDSGATTFTVARLTMTRDAAGTITGSYFQKSAPGDGVDFSQALTPPVASIKGKVYNDTNANGRQDTSESGLNRWQVYIDKNNNGSLDTGDVSVRTNTRGEYTFTNPGNSSHRVRVKTQDGFRRTQPSTGSYNVTLSAGVQATGKDFGVTQKAVIGGFVFNDADRDAVKDSNELGLSGWRVYIDNDNDGKFDTNETNVRSGSDGSWRFDNLSPGTYRVRLVQVSGFTPTSPTSNLITLSVTNGSEKLGRLFGQRTV